MPPGALAAPALFDRIAPDPCGSGVFAASILYSSIVTMSFSTWSTKRASEIGLAT